jgi:hypothetical protein
MRLCLGLFFAASMVWAQWSMQFDGKKAEAAGGFASEPGGVGALRIEFRIHDFQAAPPAGQVVLTACSQFLWLLPNSTLRLTDWAAVGESHVHDLKDRTDVIVRIQHVLDQGVTLYEMWNGNGENYSVKKLTGRREPFKCEAGILLGSNGQPGSNFSGSMAYFRWFDTTVPEGTPPTFTPEKAILAYEFEENGDEEIGVGKKLKITDGQYIKTPLYGPVVSMVTKDTTINSGETIELEATALSPIAAWEWTQVRGPSQMTIENGSTAKASVSGATEPGTYEFKVTATDAAGQSISRMVRLGVVLADESGLVKVADENMAFVLGPMVRTGSSPWPFYDKIRNEMGIKWGETYDVPPGERDVRTGHLTLTPGSRTVRGTDTHFLEDFTAAPAFTTGTVTVNTGGTEVRGTGTHFFQTFLKEIQPGNGVARLGRNSNIVEGQGTKFSEQFAAGGYILLTVPAAGFNQPEERAFRISKVIDDRSLELDRVWTSADMPIGNFRAAKDSGQLLVIEERGGRLQIMAPTVVSNTILGLPSAYEGPTDSGLRYGTSTRSDFDHLVIHYPVDEPGQQGRITLYIQRVVSNTELLLGAPYEGPALTNTPFGRVTSNELSYWMDGVNYYDSVLAQYQNFHRTGIDTYLTYARTLADNWYQGLDAGRSQDDSPLPPRMMSMAGLILRALDGRPEMWPMIRRAVKYNYNLWIGLRRDYPGLYYGVRDGGFSLYFTALMAKVDPEPASRQEFLQMAQDGAVNLYARLQKEDGSWRWEDSLWKGNAEQPFHVGLLLEGMIATHKLTNDPVILKSIVKSVDHLIEVQQPAPCRSTVYAIYNDDGPWGKFCGIPGREAPTRDEIMDSRAGNNTIMHALGYAYAMTGQEKYKQAGDDMFSATFGNLQGPGADEYWGRADTTSKQYGQSFRTSDSYLAYRLYTPPAAPPDL